MVKPLYSPLVYPFWVCPDCEEVVEELTAVWVIFPDPLAPNRFHVMFIVAALSENPARVMLLGLVFGLTRLPLELKVSVPDAFADATGS